MKENLPAVKKEGFFSKIFQKLKETFSKDKTGKQGINTLLGLTIIVDGKPIEVCGIYNDLIKEMIEQETGVKIKGRQVKLDSYSLEKRNKFLSRVVDIQSNHITGMHGYEEKLEQSREDAYIKLFGKVNARLNEIAYKKVTTEEGKYEIYLDVMKRLQTYYEDSKKTDEKGKSSRDEFMKKIDSRDSVPVSVPVVAPKGVFEKTNEDQRVD